MRRLRPYFGYLHPHRGLLTLAIACGAMMVSHVNDAYFWVVTQMSDMTVTQGYRLMTVASAIAGLTGILTVLGLSLFLL